MSFPLQLFGEFVEGVGLDFSGVEDGRDGDAFVRFVGGRRYCWSIRVFTP